MNATPENPCSRTNAVLAVHLDGDLDGSMDWPLDRDRDRDRNTATRGRRDSEHDAAFGYEFVSNESLQDHLRDCLTCRSALQRARRLDAALASTAGRVVADHVAGCGVGMPELADRLLQRALATATAPESSLVDPVEPVTAPIEPSRPWTVVAAVGVIAAGIAAWLCLTPTSHHGSTRDARPSPGTAQPPAVPQSSQAGPLPTQTGPAAASTVHDHMIAAGPAADGSRSAASDWVGPASTTPAAIAIPLALAGQLHARSRELPEQRTVSVAELTTQIADPSRMLPIRLAAARRLVRATRPGSPDARNNFDTLLAVVAGCSDHTVDEITLHDEILDELRNSPRLLGSIATRLTAIRSARGAADRELGELGTVVVAARIGSGRLDLGLRRAMRRRQDLAETVATAVRCGARADGGTALLLTAWHDQVGLGRQTNTPAWAQFWFRGQPRETFDALPTILATTRSSPERVRCLLALGCGGHETALPHLLGHLQSVRRAEAYAAACGLSAMPHRHLRALLPLASSANQGLLRAALARAGLAEARPWIAQLRLTPTQQRLLRDGPLARFAEVAAWFRDRTAATD